MNTTRSDRIVAAWTERTDVLSKSSFTCRRTFNTSAPVLLRLLCPTTEYDWLPGFECDLLHSDSGYAEYNAVFRTNVFGPEETWVCTRYETGRAVDYITMAEHYCGKLDISLVDNCDGTVTGTWVVTRLPLSREGELTEAELERARKRLTELLDWLEYYVETGEMISEVPRP